MRVRATLGGIFASAAILGITWQFGAAASSSNSASSSSATTPATTAPATTAASPSASGSPSASTAGTSAGGTFVGATENTRFGSVQVEIVVNSGTITDVKALKLTDQGGRSVQISNYAAPILRSEVLKSQSAKVASVSGATYTAEGYLSSVQSAIDKAGL